MKHFLLIACILMGSFSAANAGNGLTQSANDSAINVGRAALSAKITQLQSAYATDPSSTASMQKTTEVMQLLADGMNLSLNATFLERDKTKNAAIVTRYQAMEKANYTFRKLAGNPAQNHAELLKQAQAFAGKY